jgi:hypothetical protein
MQCRVEDDAVAVARAGLDGPGHRVADEQQAVLTGQLARLDHAAVGEGDLGAGGEIEAGLHDAVVAERDAQSGLSAQQAAFADADPLGAAAGQGAHG